MYLVVRHEKCLPQTHSNTNNNNNNNSNTVYYQFKNVNRQFKNMLINQLTIYENTK